MALTEMPAANGPLGNDPRPGRGRKQRAWIVTAAVALTALSLVVLFLARPRQFTTQHTTTTVGPGTLAPPTGRPTVDGPEALTAAYQAKPPGFIPAGASVTATLGHLMAPHQPHPFEGDVWMVTAHNLCQQREGFYIGPAQYVVSANTVFVDAESGQLIEGQGMAGSTMACRPD